MAEFSPPSDIGGDTSSTMHPGASLGETPRMQEPTTIGAPRGRSPSGEITIWGDKTVPGTIPGSTAPDGPGFEDRHGAAFEAAHEAFDAEQAARGPLERTVRSIGINGSSEALANTGPGGALRPVSPTLDPTLYEPLVGAAAFVDSVIQAMTRKPPQEGRT